MIALFVARRRRRADGAAMQASELALVQGMADTRRTLAAWSHKPGPVLARWLAVSVAISAALLISVWLVARSSTPDATIFLFPGLHRPPQVEQAGEVVLRNILVLALHALACVAGFIAGSSLPLQAEHHTGWYRTLHDKAGQFAMLFVAAATLFSLVTQSYYLGSNASTLAWQLDMSSALLVIGLLPHALPELVALFLPLGAWLYASRRGAWDELLAATFVTVAIALPIIVATAFVEVYVTPDLLRSMAGPEMMHPGQWTGR